jgi:glycosyltransferase involved in cell wall biosynthesis
MSGLLSVCITNYNRSKVPFENGALNLFPKCIDSLVSTVTGMDNVEIVIADWDSTDWKLNDWIHEKLRGLKYTLVIERDKFNRGTGRNIAADHSKGDVLFFLDADMLLDKQVIEKGLEIVSSNKAFFPQCFYFIDKYHSHGFWCTGKGNCMIKREWYEKAGKWPCPPAYRREIDEDWMFFRKIGELGVQCWSDKQKGLFHQFHPGRSVDIISTKQRRLIVRTKDIQ